LPELVADKSHGQVRILQQEIPLPPQLVAAGLGLRVVADRAFLILPTEAYLFYEQVGTFLVRNQNEILVEPHPDIPARLLRAFILGPALSVMLHQRGLLVLHASAVAVNGKAVLFLGWSGWGKSTIAAAMHAKGHAILADDVVAIRPSPTSADVFPAFPQLKLFPHIAASLGDDPDSLPRLHPRMDKRVRPAPEGFSLQPLPLGRVYVLAPHQDIGIEPVRPSAAMVELVRHSFLFQLLRFGGASLHFVQCTSLVNSVPFRRLRRSDSLADIRRLADMVEEDCARAAN
jgi:hypothetical protein